jgi:hypothetical protein
MIGYIAYLKSSDYEYQIGKLYGSFDPDNLNTDFCEFPLDLDYSYNPYLSYDDMVNLNPDYSKYDYLMIKVLGSVKHDIKSHLSYTNKYKIIKKLTRSELKDCVKNGTFKTKSGDVIHTKNGKFHSSDDQPAISRANGYKAWYNEGKLHRSNGMPAIICNHYHAWYIDGIFQRIQNNLIKKNRYFLW